MIPTMILLGLALGRWWRLSLVVGTVGWPVLLLSGGILHSVQDVAGAAALAFVNTLVGVVVHQLVLRMVRVVRRPQGPRVQHQA